jgi:serine/threonine protein kinase/Tol biopolymer transport system component
VTLTPGTRLGSYEIAAPLGAGGMGEVYRAHDTKLQRDVAVKVLPESLAHDPAALARFEREARAVAALSHPHILAIHDLGKEDGVAFAVMELLEGETLRERLAGGPLPQRKALELAREIAQGLAAAHEKGIVHRDLKPENLFLTRGGRVKILDFGLARQLAPASSDDTHSPTVPRQTDPGTVLGTVGYMSPEQVKGLAADQRSDIFSFGAVLYEMLTGRRAFQKPTAAETMTAILREDPPEPSATGVHLPPALERIVRHCLEKEPDERFRSAHDLAFALEAVSGSSAAGTLAPVEAPRARRVPLAAAAAVALAALVLGALLDRALRRMPDVPLIAIKPLTHSGSDRQPAVSPDGRSVAFDSTRDGVSRIWLKQLTTGDEVAITTGPDSTPRFSPDGSQILFVRGETVGPLAFLAPTRSDLYRAPVLGGSARRIAPVAGDADWSPDGRSIAFVRVELKGESILSTLFLVSPEGGAPKEVARYPERVLGMPRFSPDGASIAVTSFPQFGNSGARFEVVSVDGRSRRTVDVPPSLGPVSSAAWSSRSEIFYAQSLLVRYGEGRLLRQRLGGSRSAPLLWLPFESATVDVLSRGVLVAESRSTRQNLLEVSLKEPGARPRFLTRGTATDRQPVFSPDGEWVAFSSNRSGNLDVWEISTKSGALRRITEDPADDWDPGFTRDGRPIWSSGRTGHLEIWTADPDGSSPRRVSDDGTDAENPTSTPDGWVVYASSNSSKTGLWKVKLDGGGATRFGPCVNLPETSPDGRYVACPDLSVGPIRVVRVADGKVMPLVIEPPHPRASTEVQMGRVRFHPDGSRVLFVGQDESGVNGIFEQAFLPETKDTSAARRKVAGFDPNVETESFAVSPDGSRLVIAQLERVFSVVTIEGVAGVERPRRP